MNLKNKTFYVSVLVGAGLMSVVLLCLGDQSLSPCCVSETVRKQNLLCIRPVTSRPYYGHMSVYPTHSQLLHMFIYITLTNDRVGRKRHNRPTESNGIQTKAKTIISKDNIYKLRSTNQYFII